MFHIMITLQFKYFKCGFVLQNWTLATKEQIQIWFFQVSNSKLLAVGAVIPICPSTSFKHYLPDLKTFFLFIQCVLEKNLCKYFQQLYFIGNREKLHDLNLERSSVTDIKCGFRLP